MLFGNSKLYEQTRKIKIGQAELPPILDELKEWINDKYGINVIPCIRANRGHFYYS
jgi:hypothetical protein